MTRYRILILVQMKLWLICFVIKYLIFELTLYEYLLQFPYHILKFTTKLDFVTEKTNAKSYSDMLYGVLTQVFSCLCPAFCNTWSKYYPIWFLINNNVNCLEWFILIYINFNFVMWMFDPTNRFLWYMYFFRSVYKLKLPSHVCQYIIGT